MKKEKVNLSKNEVQRILDMSDMYSGSDIKVLCKEAAMGPVFDVVFELDVDSRNYRSGELWSEEYSWYSV